MIFSFHSRTRSILKQLRLTPKADGHPNLACCSKDKSAAPGNEADSEQLGSDDESTKHNIAKGRGVVRLKKKLDAPDRKLEESLWRQGFKAVAGLILTVLPLA